MRFTPGCKCCAVYIGCACGPVQAPIRCAPDWAALGVPCVGPGVGTASAMGDVVVTFGSESLCAGSYTLVYDRDTFGCGWYALRAPGQHLILRLTGTLFRFEVKSAKVAFGSTVDEWSASGFTEIDLLGGVDLPWVFGEPTSPCQGVSGSTVNVRHA